MKERPILFNADMVRALLDGRKTQTRRILKSQPPEGCGLIEVGTFAPIVIDRKGEQQPGPDTFGAFSEDGEWGLKCPYGQPGDRLWVREAFQGPLVDGEEMEKDPSYFKNMSRYKNPKHCAYRASGDSCEYVDPDGDLIQRWRPSIHMPRWASRITLEIVSVRVERLKSISKTDAEAEGVERHGDSWRDYTHPTECHFALDARTSFATLWKSINGVDSWNGNPWVWVVEFKRMEDTNDQYQRIAS